MLQSACQTFFLTPSLNQIPKASPQKRPWNWLEIFASYQEQSYLRKTATKQYIRITQFTAGGSKDAAIATPTKEPAFPAKMDKATPMPEGIAINTPTTKLRVIPRPTISSVGHFATLAHGPAKARDSKQSPEIKPMNRQMPRPISSLLKPDLRRAQSRIIVPKVIAMIGPWLLILCFIKCHAKIFKGLFLFLIQIILLTINGEMSILATNITVLFSRSPRQAITLWMNDN